MNINLIKFVLFFLLFLCGNITIYAQEYQTNKNAHSHNDYNQDQPFYTASSCRFASIEIDVFLVGDELFVAHDRADIDSSRTIEKVYIDPLLSQVKNNGGKIYPGGGTLQLLIDLKTEAGPTLRCLEQKLKPIRHYFDITNNTNAVRLVISGNMPSPEQFNLFDEIFCFDGRPHVNYTDEQLKRVPMFSTSLKQFTNWNGLGRIPENEYTRVKAFVDSVHYINRKVRFWGNPDTKTGWQSFIKLGVDYINTDSPAALAAFLDTYDKNTYQSVNQYQAYQPSYENDGADRKPKNIILLISDGAGFAQIWAAATANRGMLNVMNINHLGYINTSSSDDYDTDSAAAGTALSTGEKTRNRYIGVDSLAHKLLNLPEQLDKLNMISGIVTNDRITGATPSSFFAHRKERDMADSIAYDLLQSPASLFIGGSHPVFGPEGGRLLKKLKDSGFTVLEGVEQLKGKPLESGKKVICFDQDNVEKGYRMIEPAFDESVRILASRGKGFFLMLEGAKIDAGGHTNNVGLCIDEYLSFDKVVGKALEYADRDGETLVLVTSDHETGGLALLDGNYLSGKVLGHFATNDHTGIPVSLFAYGPGSARFTGFLNNSDVPKIILQILKE